MVSELGTCAAASSHLAVLWAPRPVLAPLRAPLRRPEPGSCLMRPQCGCFGAAGLWALELPPVLGLLAEALQGEDSAWCSDS